MNAILSRVTAFCLLSLLVACAASRKPVVHDKPTYMVSGIVDVAGVDYYPAPGTSDKCAFGEHMLVSKHPDDKEDAWLAAFCVSGHCMLDNFEYRPSNTQIRSLTVEGIEYFVDRRGEILGNAVEFLLKPGYVAPKYDDHVAGSGHFLVASCPHKLQVTTDGDTGYDLDKCTFVVGPNGVVKR